MFLIVNFVFIEFLVLILGNGVRGYVVFLVLVLLLFFFCFFNIIFFRLGVNFKLNFLRMIILGMYFSVDLGYLCLKNRFFLVLGVDGFNGEFVLFRIIGVFGDLVWIVGVLGELVFDVLFFWMDGVVGLIFFLVL